MELFTFFTSSEMPTLSSSSPLSRRKGTATESAGGGLDVTRGLSHLTHPQGPCWAGLCSTGFATGLHSPDPMNCNLLVWGHSRKCNCYKPRVELVREKWQFTTQELEVMFRARPLLVWMSAALWSLLQWQLLMLPCIPQVGSLLTAHSCLLEMLQGV